MPIVDNRQNSKNLAAGSRKKFIDRYKQKIKKEVEEIAKDKSIKDIAKSGNKVKIKTDPLSQPTFAKDDKTGVHRRVFANNKSWSRGDKLFKPKGGGQGTQGSPDGTGEDTFTFRLTKEEFLDLYFSDMELPDYIKKNLKQSNITIRKRAGVSPVGPPPRLNYKKTILQHLMRQIATKKKPDNSVPLDTIDLRYNKYNRVPKPDKDAVMFCVLDASGSMGELEKTIAKKFFLLLYIFLHKAHNKVDIVFIRHTNEAQEVDEDTFFSCQDTGGTIVSTALELVSQIIQERYTPQTNVYVAQASDGDNWIEDDANVEKLMPELLPKLQYFAYIQTEELERVKTKRKWQVQDLWNMYERIRDASKENILHMRRVHEAKDVYEVLHDLFKKR